MNSIDLIAQVRSGIAQVSVERDRERVGSGSAFLVHGGLVTNSHVIRPARIDAICIRFEDTDPDDASSYIRLLPETCYKAIAAESPENDKDYAFLQLSESEFGGRHLFEFTNSADLSAGQQVLFLGFPFGMSQLTCHLGYISSMHTRNGVDIIQIDGSVNGGNSGGPLLDLRSGKVVGIVTRAVTGFIAEQFDQLISALRKNQEALSQGHTLIKVGGIDPIQAIRASQAAMEQIARNLRSSANVGIGYAYSSNYVRDRIASLNL